MNKLLLAKIALTLAIIAIVISYTVYNLSKTPTSSAPPVVVKAKAATKTKAEKPVLSSQAKNQQQTSEANEPQEIQSQEIKKAKPNRFGQNSDKVLADFKSEPVLDASWAYTQEQLLYNLITQEIYPNEGIKVADELTVECKSETCLVSTKLESFEQVEKFYGALIGYGQNKGYEFAPVKMSPEETIFSVYPPKP
ncbi:hypothetical protein [Kangiella sp. TOML190]|uniref:hypothetical protein n=1 Tax=Kangiella sp. TOML190 TaxID=2931351 RepID=UPI00203E1315|nr:hypothetical protein [Kangiella sp. TOML190]